MSQDPASSEASAEGQAAIKSLKLARDPKYSKFIIEGNAKTVIYALRGHTGFENLSSLGIISSN